MNQTQAVYNYLKSGGVLTPEKAKTLFGITRLAARVDDIQAGRSVPESVVERTMVTVPTRDGKTRVAKYWMLAKGER